MLLIKCLSKDYFNDQYIICIYFKILYFEWKLCFKKQISNYLIRLKGESLIFWQTDFILIKYMF